MKKKIDWNKIVSIIVNDLPINQNILLNEEYYCFRYIGDIMSRQGYLLIWEEKSKRGINISRVKCPPNFPMINWNDVSKEKLPQIILEDKD